MQGDNEPIILVEDVPYEIKALDAYLNGQIAAKDLMASLDV